MQLAASLLPVLFILTPYQVDESEDQPLPPLEAAATMQVPEGFEVTLFASEPAIRQPISFCIDDHERLWVAEAYNYPNHTREPGDRIVVLEDTDGDGRFDERTVFFDQLNYVTGVEVGFGGVWVMSPPYFYFIPDRDGDLIPDSEPEVLLDGFGTHANAHNLANGFAWGPDGWLYGTHGRTNWSMIGRPGTADDERTRFDGGVYRYHPVKHVWESYADGTTNPWGIDWNDVGDAFICNCVNPHLFQVIQGAHYEPWRNRDSSKFAYQRVSTIADHLHFVGGGDVRAGIGSDNEDLAGGGHAHCGMMVYLGDNWPSEYRNSIFMNNIHGRRINQDIPKRTGSGYVASHGPDLMRSLDTWFMGVTITYGFDGCVYVSDWSDTGECHSVRNTRKHTGRIYRISYGNPSQFDKDLATLSDDELVELQLHANDRVVRHARRNLQERFASGRDMTSAGTSLRRQFDASTEIPRKLRSLWAMHVIDQLDRDFLVSLLQADSENLRAWAIKLLCESDPPTGQELDQLVQLASTESASYVRLHLACALQRLETPMRWALATQLVAREEDMNDANIPLLLWYGIEPLVHDDIQRFINLTTESRIPLIQNHGARRVVALNSFESPMNELIASLENADDSTRIQVFDGLLLALEGRRNIEVPSAWRAVFEKLVQEDQFDVMTRAVRLAVRFHDPDAIATLRRLSMDTAADAALRNESISVLVDARIENFDDDLIQLVNDSSTNEAAIRGLSRYQHPATVEILLLHYDSMHPAAQQAAIQTLATRNDWAIKLVEAIEKSEIPRDDVTAFTARQLVSLNDDEISERLEASWGKVRTTDADKRTAMQRYRRILTGDIHEAPDLAKGRALFEQHCATCHRFFGNGESIGPDLSGSQRGNLDYLLENIVDPSAAVARDYQMEIFELSSGRVINGIIVTEDSERLSIRTVDETVTIAVDEVDNRTLTNKSIMPDGILEPLDVSAIRDLFHYLESDRPVDSEN